MKLKNSFTLKVYREYLIVIPFYHSCPNDSGLDIGDYRFKEFPAEDKSIGEMILSAMKDQDNLTSWNEIKKRKNTPFAKINEIRKWDKNDYMRRYISMSLAFENNKYTLSPDNRTNSSREVADPPPFTLHGDATAEELGAAVRKALAMCNEGYNEYLSVLYPNADKAFLKSLKPVPEGAGPLPFGVGMAWLAVKTKEWTTLQKPVFGQVVKEKPWGKAMDALETNFTAGWAYLTPPINGWTFVISLKLSMPSAKRHQWVAQRLGNFSQVLFFAEEKISGSYEWTRYEKGKVKRHFHRCGDSGIQEFAGKVTKEEKELFPYASKPQEDWFPHTGDVVLLAGAWSLNPEKFAPGQPQVVGPGLWGKLCIAGGKK